MNKILTRLYLGAFCFFCTLECWATEKFEILPDLPEPLLNSAAQASSVSTVSDTANTVTQTVGQEPNLISIVFSLLFVILLIYATGIIYAKLNKLGFNTLKKQMGEVNASRASVVSTTHLGNNKTLHVVDLDGKRMLIGASANSIHLIKDLGSYPPEEIEEGKYSKIEIPNIRIPRIEIPKIEIPGFTKVVASSKDEEIKEAKNTEDDDKFEISDIYEEENPDGIIDKLFHTAAQESAPQEKTEEKNLEHSVDPDEFALYKKYL